MTYLTFKYFFELSEIKLSSGIVAKVVLLETKEKGSPGVNSVEWKPSKIRSPDVLFSRKI